MRAFVLSLFVCLAACGPDLPETKTPTAGQGHALAAELDPGPVSPVWKTLPEAARRDLESGAARSNPVEASRGRLEREKLAWDFDDEAKLHSRLRSFLEALFMLEPVAFGPPGRDHDEAETLLLRFWSAATGFRPLAKAVEVNGQARGDAALDPAILKQLGELADKHVRYFGARVLRHATFEAEDLEILAVAFETNEEKERSLHVWNEIVKRAPEKMRARDWISYSRCALAMDDPKTAADALAKAKATSAAKSNDEADLLEARKLEAGIRWSERHQQLVASLRARAKGTGVDAELAKADIFAETGRTNEAKARYETLAKQFPDDPRVRVRRSQQIFASFGEGISLFDAADKAYDYLHKPGLAEEDAELTSWSLGLTGTIGMQILASAGNQPDPKAYLKTKFPGLLVDLGKANAALGKHDPGRAAVNQFLLERTADIVRADEPETMLVKQAPSWLADVRKLIVQYPKTDDAYRVYFAMAPFAGDDALAIVKTMPPANDDDVTVFLQRANVASMLAALRMTPEWIAMAKQTAEEIPATDDDGNEGMRAALRGDATSLEAIQSKSVEKWRTATRLYEVARDHVKAVQRPRVLNNLGFALQGQGLGAEAIAAWQESATFQVERKWVAVLNGVFAQTTDRSARLGVLGEIENAFGAAKRDIPPLVHAWHADLAEEPVKSQEAKIYVDSLDGSILRIPRANLGLELEGNFNVRMGVTTTKRTHVLDVSFGAMIWLAPNPSVDQNALRKLAPKKK